MWIFKRLFNRVWPMIFGGCVKGRNYATGKIVVRPMSAKWHRAWEKFQIDPEIPEKRPVLFKSGGETHLWY